jgi:hypothetical protein
MPNAALSGEHVAGLIMAAQEGKGWDEAEQKSVEDGGLPSTYVISKARMEEAKKKPEVSLVGNNKVGEAPIVDLLNNM